MKERVLLSITLVLLVIGLAGCQQDQSRRSGVAPSLPSGYSGGGGSGTR